MSLDVRSVSACAALVWLWVGCSAGAKTSGGGGAAGAGNATSSGGTSSGGAATGGSCGITECFRAVECVLGCGQQPVSVGCCPCNAPAFDSIACQSTGGTGSGGTSTGGGTSSGGTSSGGAGSCTIPECLRPVACVLGCGQEPVSVSCCPCQPPAFDSIACQGTGGTGSGGTGGSGGALCGDSVCSSGQACACGGPGAALQCACGNVCKTNTDCGGDQPVCCGGVCTTACLCFCD